MVLYESKIRLGHPSWISGPLMEKLPVSRGEIAFGFPPILWPDFRLVPLVSRSPEDDLETCAMTVFVSLASNVIHREIARSKLQIKTKLEATKSVSENHLSFITSVVFNFFGWHNGNICLFKSRYA